MACMPDASEFSGLQGTLCLLCLRQYAGTGMPAMGLHATATLLLLPRFTHPTTTAAISTNPR